MKLEVIEILKVNADPYDLTDQDKIIATIVINGEEKKVVLPDQNIESHEDFIKFLANVVNKIDVKKEKKVINLSTKWKGTYEVK